MVFDNPPSDQAEETTDINMRNIKSSVSCSVSWGGGGGEGSLSRRRDRCVSFARVFL